MVTIKRDLSSELEELILYPIADTHWSDPTSNHELIMEDIAYIHDTPNVYCILNGDLMNCAIKSSVSDCYNTRGFTPMDELEKCVEIFAPISDKVICVTTGNHEERHYKTNGIDVTRLFCQQLGIEDKYSPTAAYVFLRFGRSNDHAKRYRPILYTIYATHGNGGGRKDGGKIQRLADYATICDADIYIGGHTHLGAGFKKGFIRPNPTQSTITYGKRLFVNTCASLEYDGSYGERQGFDVPCLDRPLIYLNGTRKKMYARI